MYAPAVAKAHEMIAASPTRAEIMALQVRRVKNKYAWIVIAHGSMEDGG
jgi:hypothetical protein